jgi:glycosyltransferase involved in cell wall biosynthesis
MYAQSTIGVVVPAYNEADFVDEVIHTVPDFVDRVYVVDDGSTDETWQTVVRAARSENSDADLDGVDRWVIPIRHQVNRGVGASIKTGYRRALEDGMAIVAVMAGDGQMDPDHLPRLLDPIIRGEADYAKGNRLAGTSDRTTMSRWRLFGNAVLTGLTRVASGYWSLSDPQNGYTAISADALSAIDIDGLYDRYGFCDDLLVRLNLAGMSVEDVAMPAIYGDEESSIQYRTFVPWLSWLLWRRFIWRLAATHGPLSRPRPDAGGGASADAVDRDVVVAVDEDDNALEVIKHRDRTGDD